MFDMPRNSSRGRTLQNFTVVKKSDRPMSVEKSVTLNQPTDEEKPHPRSFLISWLVNVRPFSTLIGCVASIALRPESFLLSART